MTEYSNLSPATTFICDHGDNAMEMQMMSDAHPIAPLHDDVTLNLKFKISEKSF